MAAAAARATGLPSSYLSSTSRSAPCTYGGCRDTCGCLPSGYLSSTRRTRPSYGSRRSDELLHERLPEQHVTHWAVVWPAAAREAASRAAT